MSISLKVIACENWRDNGSKDSGDCTLGLFGGNPSHGTCVHECPNGPRLPHPPIDASKAQKPAPPSAAIKENRAAFLATLKPVPFSQWEPHIHAIAALRVDAEKTVADTARRVGAPIKLLLRTFGIKCGCAERYEEWSIQYVY